MPLGSSVDLKQPKKESVNLQISEIIQVKHKEFKKRTRAWGFYLTRLNTCIIRIPEEDRAEEMLKYLRK